ncbi:30S ribosomal protein S27ae [Candidatus Woesearchaeota archaeon]|nr:30S ribosomal protein S27ae [Candidatus Woesearchaeota archaeon]
MAKKQRKPKKTSKVSNNYTVSGGKLETKNKTCPKCGAGVFMAKHKDRLTCGRCHYMEKI